MSAPEWAYLQAHGDGAVVAAMRRKVVTFEPGAPVVPGIRSVALPGHTLGHSGYEIRSGNDRLFDIGDIAHSVIVSLSSPEWVIQYDGDKTKGRETREAELANLAARHERVFAPHFPYPGVGYIVKAGQAYHWQPAE
jgi:glyoxylase-like metal-dependent hydrolase (beta-lactamase superfamily II)